MLMETRCWQKKMEFQKIPAKFAVPLAMIWVQIFTQKLLNFPKKKKKKKKTGQTLAQGRPDKSSAKCSFRSGEIPSPRQTSIDQSNDCVMTSERGALVRGSELPSGQYSQHGRLNVTGAGQASDTKTFGRWCLETDNQKISIPLRWQKTDFFQFWEKSIGRRGQPLDP